MDLIDKCKNNRIIIIFLVLSFLGGFGMRTIVDKLDNHEKPKEATGYQIRTATESKYKYINPLLECEVGGILENGKIINFKNRVERYINEVTNNEQISHASVYYRDLNNGPWVGINEEEAFFPASLSKVPLMMAYFKKSEIEPELFTKVIRYQKHFDTQFTQLTPPKERIEVGKSYSIGELIERMIIYSDNEATALLLNNIEEEFVARVSTDLGVTGSPTINGEYVITARVYGSFFRVLFNASYLSRENSERALEILSQVDFKDGLRDGIPEEISIAHKFGERVIYSPTGAEAKQLHDCGIVYFPEHPYLLCVMTRGKDLENLKQVIQGVSRFVYEDMKDGFEQ
jgi:beta-lactamase class A